MSTAPKVKQTHNLLIGDKLLLQLVGLRPQHGLIARLAKVLLDCLESGAVMLTRAQPNASWRTWVLQRACSGNARDAVAERE